MAKAKPRFGLACETHIHNGSALDCDKCRILRLEHELSVVKKECREKDAEIMGREHSVRMLIQRCEHALTLDALRVWEYLAEIEKDPKTLDAPELAKKILD